MNRWALYALLLALPGCPTTGEDDGGLDGGVGDAQADSAADGGPADAAPGDDAGRDALTDADLTDADLTDAIPTDAAPADATADATADAAPDAGPPLVAGELDPTFGNGGVVEEALGQSAEVRDLHVDAQGRAWLAGSVREADGWNMLAARLTDTGDLDPTFSADGWASIDFAGGADQAFACDVNAENSMILAGFRTDGSANPALVQLTADGELDPSLSRLSPPGLQSGTYRHIAFVPQGLVAVGEVRAVGDFSSELVTRHSPDGALLDGPDGVVELNHPADVRLRASTISPDGTIALAGHVEAGLDDQALLATFNGDGDLAVHLRDDEGGARDRFLALAPSPAGYLAAGESAGDLLIEHLDAAGQPVAGFGNNGRVTLDIGGGRDRAQAAALHPDGRILIAGSTEVDGITRFLVMRFTADGQPDPTFGNQGRVQLHFGHADQDAEAHSLAFTPDARFVVVAGAVGPHGARRIALARLGL